MKDIIRKPSVKRISQQFNINMAAAKHIRDIFDKAQGFSHACDLLSKFNKESPFLGGNRLGFGCESLSESKGAVSWLNTGDIYDKTFVCRFGVVTVDCVAKYLDHT